MRKVTKERFQNSYEDHLTQVDSDKLWAAIETKRQPKKKRGIIFLLPFGLLILAITSYYYYPFSVDSTPVEKKLIGSELISAKQQNHESTTVKKQRENEDLGDSKLGKRENNKFELEKDQAIKSVEIVGSKEIFQTNKVSNLNTVSSTVVKKNQVLSEVSDNTVLSKLPNDEFSGQLTKRPRLSLSPKLSSMRSQIYFEKHQLSIGRESEHHVFLEETAETDNQSKWSLKILGGMMPYMEMCSDTINRRATEPLRSISINAFVEYRLTNKWSLGTGLNYTRISELFQRKERYIADQYGNYFSKVDSDFILDSFIGQRSSAKYFSLVEQNIKKYNYHNLLSIPLYVQYDILQGKVGLDIYLRGAVSIVQSSNGYVLDSSNHDRYAIAVELDSSDYFSSLSWGSGLELNYQFKNNFQLLAQVGVTFRQLRETTVCSKFVLPNLELGLGYKLTR